MVPRAASSRTGGGGGDYVVDACVRVRCDGRFGSRHPCAVRTSPRQVVGDRVGGPRSRPSHRPVGRTAESVVPRAKVRRAILHTTCTGRSCGQREQRFNRSVHLVERLPIIRVERPPFPVEAIGKHCQPGRPRKACDPRFIGRRMRQQRNRRSAGRRGSRAGARGQGDEGNSDDDEPHHDPPYSDAGHASPDCSTSWTLSSSSSPRRQPIRPSHP